MAGMWEVSFRPIISYQNADNGSGVYNIPAFNESDMRMSVHPENIFADVWDYRVAHCSYADGTNISHDQGFNETFFSGISFKNKF